MIRICFVHHGKGIGGAPLSLLYLIRGLDRSRFEPTVVCIHESEAADLFRADGIRTIVLPRIRDFSHTNVLWYPWWQWPKLLHRLLHLPFAVERARAFFAGESFDIVHLNTSTLLAFGIAAKRLGMRVVWHIREPIQRGYCGARRRLVRTVIRDNADLVIAICRYDASQLFPADNIHVVYNFVDPVQFPSDVDPRPARAALGIPDGCRMALMLGGVNRIKGTHVFVDAAVQLLERHSDLMFCVAGAIPDASIRNRLNGAHAYWNAVRGRIPAGLADRIRFLGVRSDVPLLLAACDVLCFPSTVPHFARPIIEASAMGRAVVASDLGGPQELVRHERTGLLVTPEDSAALADALLALTRDEAMRLRMGVEGAAFAREAFDANTNTRRIIALYDQVLEHS
jgi:glycosyltransferase involved in cell wall biosynthesis